MNQPNQYTSLGLRAFLKLLRACMSAYEGSRWREWRLSETLDSRPFRPLRTQFAHKARSKSVSMMTELNQMNQPWFSCTSERLTHVCVGIWRPEVARNMAFKVILDSRPFRRWLRPRFARKPRSNHVPKMVQSNQICHPWLVCPFKRFTHVCVGAGKPKLTRNTTFKGIMVSIHVSRMIQPS